MTATRIYLLSAFLIANCFLTNLIAQKPALDTALFGKWPEIQQPKISSDGRYSTYFVKNETPGSDYLHVVSNLTNWNFQVKAGHSPLFSGNSGFLFFLKPPD